MADSKKPEMNSPNQDNSAKRSLKRKRASLIDSLSTQEKANRIDALREELNGLFKYYKEVLDKKVKFDLGNCGSSNSVIACMIEESNLPFSKLVDEIFEKMKVNERESSSSVTTLASVKSSVLFVGQRCSYGLTNPDADVLEDQSESCLWCWETRDLKLMPKIMKSAVKIRRTCRKKIHERLTAVSAMITALEKSQSSHNYSLALTKASEKLAKVLSEADIRLLAESMEQKNGADMAEKEVKQEEKLLIKQLEKNKREVEKGKKRMDLEQQKEKWQSEKELKRLQDEAEKEEKRREKEESEMRKHLRRQQEEVEKDLRRREKEEAELKKQLALQKQASIMERFLKRSKNNSTSQNGQSSSKATTSNPSPNRSENMPESITMSMDYALALKNEINTEDIHKSHLVTWRRLGHSVHSNRKQHWGIRRKPRTELVKELKLTSGSGATRDDDLSIEKLVDGWDETSIDGRSCHRNADCSLPSGQKHNRSKQLLQFDKNNRPAFYGIWPKKSQVVGPRHPFEKDAELDYDIDSDEEWEEEEPGENLSDCEMDDDKESLEEGCSKADDEDESEDGFFVPDGYLSENEGVQVDRMESDRLVEEARSSQSCKQELESEEFCMLLRQQKHLRKLTEHALRKNQPLIILNLMHEKAPSSTAEDLTGSLKLEQTCLQALGMRAFPGGSFIEISPGSNVLEEDQEACPSSCKVSTTPVATATAIMVSDLPQIVSAIQSCSQGINKVVESLQHKFPTIPKSQLRNKVREISDFVDNRWQVSETHFNSSFSWSRKIFWTSLVYQIHQGRVVGEQRV
ncbi:chromatin assembly factor 1 subunit FAS1 isoform X2 [Cornus florida]|uniref:chromatin assembly factor 1 subunit FAS1 isoform X2 n=1 Tax=Cornus florida TaxID=4283 RepID=UPI00289DFD9F|nr:chromatin assembly factor 1 subunit FAS1 isoform X2 [Cornus florida]